MEEPINTEVTRATEETRNPSDFKPLAIKIKSVGLVMLVVFATIFFLAWAKAILVPLVLSILISYSLAPMVTWINRLKIPRALIAIILLSGLTLSISYGVYSLRDQAETILDKIPKALQQLRVPKAAVGGRYQAPQEEGKGIMEKVQDAAEEIEKVTEEVTTKMDGKESSASTEVTNVIISQSAFDIRNYIWQGTMGALALGGNITVMVIFVFLFLVAGDLYKRKLIKITGSRFSDRKTAVEIVNDFNRQLKQYLFILLLSCIFVGVATWLAFLWIGLEEAAVWGVIAGVATLIPYVGPAIIFVTTGIVALLQFGTIPMALLVAITSLGITGFQGYALLPLLASKTANINTIAIFLGLVFWGWLWGPLGLLVATPILIIIKVICDHIENLNPISELLGN